MTKIKWTPQSLEDIAAVANIIKRDSSYYARMFTIKVFETVDRLELFPESGRVVSVEILNHRNNA